MMNFTFNSVSSLVVRTGGANDLASYVDSLECKKVLFITDPGILKNNLSDEPIQSLRAAGFEVNVFSDVVADPPVQVIYDAVSFAKKFNVDCVIGFGGGSSMDVAKLVSLVANTDDSLESMYGVNNAKGTRLKLILIPTTSGTGSEVTPISIVTTGENEKKGVVSPLLLPDIALLDANLTLGLPGHITAATGIDAMVHAIEAYTGKIHKNKISDAFAKEALKLISQSIHTACKEGNNIQARENMLLGASLAGIAFANSPVAAVHALAYPIGARHHVPHGLSNSLVLPAVVNFNKEYVGSQYAELYDIVCPNNNQVASRKNQEFSVYLSNLAKDLGLPSKMSEVGISGDDIKFLAEDAMKQTRLLVNNPREMDLKNAQRIYEESL